MFNPVFESPFYPGMFGENTQRELRNHRVWPLIVALKLDYNLYLQCLLKPNGDVTKYVMCDGNGFRQIIIEAKTDPNEPILISKTSGSLKTLKADLIPLAESKNIKYLLASLNRMIKDTASNVANIKDQGRQHFFAYTSKMIGDAIYSGSEFSGRSRYRPNLDTASRTLLLKLFAGEIGKNDIPFERARHIEKELHELNERYEKHRVYKQQMLDYLSGPKIAFIYDDSNPSSLLFGAFEFTNTEGLIDHAFNSDSSWYDGPPPAVHVNHCFRRYLIKDQSPALPEELKDVVMSTLHLDKMNRTSNRSFDNQNPLFPCSVSGIVLFNNSSSFCWRDSHSGHDANWFVLSDKRGLLA